MRVRRSTAYNIQDIFSVLHLNQHINIVWSVVSFLKIPEILCALFWLWLSSELIFSQKIFSPVVFQGARAHFILTTSAPYRVMQNRRVGRGDYIPQDGQLFHLHEEEESVCQKPSLKGKILSLFSWLWGRKQSWCKSHASLRGHSPHKRLPLQCDDFDHGQNFSSTTPMKMWAHSTVYSWDVVVLCDTDSFRNKG